VLMEKGEIVEAGTHAELIALDGRYRKLYELQFEAEATETVSI
jgi:ABC-type multidrug transport system fused ATPase/permease subunit